MTLPAGTRLGQYEITGALGAGGMGEVYRARDTRLHRDVAIKTLPPAFAADRDRLTRFEREAQSLAALNHPHIAQIFGIIEAPPALVMELVEGEELAQRIARGPLPIADALPIAAQVAEGLEYAHERGIIHRDLKPANIRITEDGVVKVLDFGLAKAVAHEAAAANCGPADLANSPTFTSPAMTQMGIILGTAAYMAPEQAKGKPADRRADVWAFGGVLFEMLTAKRAFPGDDVTDVIASIMRGEPEWSALPVDTPASIGKLLRRCLEKDRAKRLDSMAVARFEIQDALAAPELPPPATPPATRRRSVLPLAATAVVAAALGAAAAWIATRPRETPAPVVRVHVTPPPPDSLSLDTFVGDVDISPDGSTIVYSGKRGAGPAALFVRRLDQAEGVALPGTADGRGPTFTADGRWVSFQAITNILKVPVQGGASQTVCAQCAGGFRGGTWLADDSYVFSTSGGQEGLRRLRPGATQIDAVTQVDHKSGERRHVFPRALPDGRGVLFAIESVDDTSQIAVLDLRTKTTKPLSRGGGAPQYAPSGHLLYAASGTLYAVPFDLETLESRGVPSPVIEGIVTKSAGGASYAVAPNGTLAYVAGSQVSSNFTVSVGRATGAREMLPLSPGAYIIGRFSPDGRQAIFDSRAFALDLWVWAFAPRTQRRLTFAPGPDQYPVWTPDGRQIVYAGYDGGSWGVFRRNADGSGEPERLTRQEAILFPTAITPDAGTLIAHAPAATPTMPRGIYQIAMTGERAPQLLAGTALNAMNADLARDGKWIAYQSNESGRDEILVQPYPNLAGGRWQVSSGGGSQPLFSRKGNELFYRDASRRLISVPVEFGAGFTHGNARVVLEDVMSPGPGRPFDIAADGRIILVHESGADQTGGRPPQLNLVFNWVEELQRLAVTTK